MTLNCTVIRPLLSFRQYSTITISHHLLYDSNRTSFASTLGFITIITSHITTFPTIHSSNIGKEGSNSLETNHILRNRYYYSRRHHHHKRQQIQQVKPHLLLSLPSSSQTYKSVSSLPSCHRVCFVLPSRASLFNNNRSKLFGCLHHNYLFLSYLRRMKNDVVGIDDDNDDDYSRSQSGKNNDNTITSTMTPPNTIDIEEIHKRAIIEHNSTTYIDPVTGFYVFSELAHLRRGYCCGNQCRHCPYGWSNANIHKNSNNYAQRPIPKVQSGDKEQIHLLLQSYQEQSDEYNMKQKEDDHNVHDDGLSGIDQITDGTCVLTNTNPNGEEIQQQRQQSDHHDMNRIVHANNNNKKTGGRHGGTYTNKNVPYTRTGDNGTSQIFTGERRYKDDIIFHAMGEIDELCSITGVIYSHLLERQKHQKEDQGQPKEEQQQQNETKRTIPNNNDGTIGTNTDNYGMIQEWLLDIMSCLFDIGSSIAKPKQKCNGNDSIFEDHMKTLEEWIDDMTNELPELTVFILPTGTIVSSQFHVARTVCRRTERTVTSLSLSYQQNQQRQQQSYQKQQHDDDNDDSISDEDVSYCVLDPYILKYINRLSDFYFTAARYMNYVDGYDEIQYRKPIRNAKQRHRVIVPNK